MGLDLQQKLENIKVLALDVDGVLTDGKIIIDSNGEELKAFDVKDGYGIARFRRAGFKVAIITARSSKAVEARAKDLNIDCLYQDAYPKIDAYCNILETLKVKDAEVCFVGDDMPDMPILDRVGLSVTVADGIEQLKSTVDYVTKRNGGNGAVREVVEMIIKAQNK